MNLPLIWRAALTCLGMLVPVTVAAQPSDLRFTQISNLSAVVDIANAGDGTGRLFLVRQSGTVYINNQGEDLMTPFLDIRNRVEDSGNEQGLLSLAFSPDYAESGYFYAWYTGGGGGTVLSRFRVSADPNLADPNSEEILLVVPQPFSNHNGGRLQFGPDGMLYLGLGDGGGSFDPLGAGQHCSRRGGVPGGMAVPVVGESRDDHGSAE